MDHAQSKCNGEKGVGALPEMPAQPAGAVPDSLRALSEDETKRIVREEMAKLWDAEEAPSSAAMIRAGKWDDTDPVRSAIQGALFLREAIASHPAGQSAGQGVEATAHLKPCPWEEPHLCCYPKCTCASDREPAAVPAIVRLKDAMLPFLQERERWSDPRFKHGDERHAYLTLGSIRRLCAAYEAVTDVPPSVWTDERRTSEAQP